MTLKATGYKASPDILINFGSAVKALGDGIVEGILVPFTSADQTDLYDEYFNADSDLFLKDFPIVGGPVLYQHALDEVLGVKRIGTFLKAAVTDAGVWVQAQIDMADDYGRMIYDLVEKGILGWSSGALPQGVVVRHGHIKKWPVIEGSLTPTPAMPFLTRIHPLKSLLSLPPEEVFPALKALERPKEESGTGSEGVEPGAGTNSAPPVLPSTSKTAAVSPKGGEEKMVKRIKNAGTTLAAGVQKVVDDFIATVIGQLEGEVPPDEVATVTEEVLDVAAAQGVDLQPLEDPELTTMLSMDEDDLPEGKSADMEVVRETLDWIASEAIKAWNSRGEQASTDRRSAFGGYAKSAVEKAKKQRGTSARDKKGGANITPRGGGAGRVEVSENLKYAHLSATEMLLGYQMMKAAIPKGLRVKMDEVASEEYLVTMANKAHREIVSPRRGIDARNRHAAKMALADERAVKAAFPFKANELDATNIPTQGEEWVGVLYGTELWEKAHNNVIFDQLLARGVRQYELGQGEGSVVIPTEEDEPLAYTAMQANSVDVTGRPEVTAVISPFKTGKKTVSPAEVKIATSYTVQLEEDSIIALAPYVEDMLERKAQETLEQLLINGDTEMGGNANINYINGTPDGGLFKPYYVAFDGAIKQALITGPGAGVASARDAGGDLSLTDYLATVALFPRTIQARKDQIAFIIDPDVENATRLLPELLTWGANGERATVWTGDIGELFNMDILVSGFMERANAAGKVPLTNGQSTGTLGRILALYAPYWAWVWKRGVTIETDRDILSGTQIYVASLRAAFQSRGNNAAVMSYNVGIELLDE